MADCCLIKKVATVEVYENKNEVRAYGFMAGDRNTPVMEVRFKHLWGESNLSSCKLRWIIVDDVGSLLVGEVPIQSDNTALINLPNELFTGDRRMKVQLTVASCDGERILNLQQFTDLKVINSLAPNEVVEPVYQILINAIYDESQKYLKELETSYTQKYGSLDSLYKSARASLEQYLITAENGGNAEFLQGYSPAHFKKVENTINDLIASTKYKVGDVVEVLGYYEKGDGAGHPRQKKATGYNGADAVIGADGSIWGIVHDGEINVGWFGAKGDGVSDDTNFIQKAVTSPNILTVTGFKTNRLTNTIKIEKCLKIQKFNTISDAVAFSLNNAHDSVFTCNNFDIISTPKLVKRWSGGNWVVPSIVTSKTEEGYQWTPNDSKDIVVSESDKTNFCTGITIENSDRVLVENTTGNFVRITIDYSNNCMIRNNNFRGGMSFGCIEFGAKTIFENTKNYGNVAINNIIKYGSYNGIMFVNSQDYTCVGNEISFCGESGIKTYQQDIEEAYCKNGVIDRNKVEKMFHDGIDASSKINYTNRKSLFTKITNNNCFDCKETALIIDGANNYIQGNTSLNCDTNIMVMSDSNFITNNYITPRKNNNRQHGLVIQGANNLCIGNRVEDTEGEYVSILISGANNITTGNDVRGFVKGGSISDLTKINNSVFDNYEGLVSEQRCYANFKRKSNIESVSEIYTNNILINYDESSIQDSTPLKEETAILRKIESNRYGFAYEKVYTKNGKATVNYNCLEEPVSLFGAINESVTFSHDSSGVYLKVIDKNGAVKTASVAFSGSLLVTLDTPYHATNMQKLGILDSYHNYLTELHEYEKSQNVQSDSEIMALNILRPPVIPAEVEAYAKEYNLI